MNSQKVESIGYEAFFTHFSTINVLYEDQLNDFNKFRKYPNEIKHKRNILLYLTAGQVLAALVSMIIIVVRRSFIYILINLLTMVLAFSGIYGGLKMTLIPLIIHCVFTTSITGGFFVYQILDLFISTDTAYGNTKRFNDNLILFLFSLPYLYDCYVGLYNYFFLKNIAQFNTEQRHNDLLKQEQDQEAQINKKKFTEEQINHFLSEVDSKTCIICMTEDRNTVMNPCGHILCCEECAKSLFNNRRRMFSAVSCPVCKRKCENYIQVFVA